jgi:hypothetical protein
VVRSREPNESDSSHGFQHHATRLARICPIPHGWAPYFLLRQKSVRGLCRRYQYAPAWWHVGHRRRKGPSAPIPELATGGMRQTRPGGRSERHSQCPCTGTGASENDGSAFVRDVRARINCQDDVGGVSTLDKGQTCVEGSWKK